MAGANLYYLTLGFIGSMASMAGWRFTKYKSSMMWLFIIFTWVAALSIPSGREMVAAPYKRVVAYQTETDRIMAGAPFTYQGRVYKLDHFQLGGLFTPNKYTIRQVDGQGATIDARRYELTLDQTSR